MCSGPPLLHVWSCRSEFAWGPPHPVYPQDFHLGICSIYLNHHIPCKIAEACTSVIAAFQAPTALSPSPALNKTSDQLANNFVWKWENRTSTCKRVYGDMIEMQGRGNRQEKKKDKVSSSFSSFEERILLVPWWLLYEEKKAKEPTPFAEASARGKRRCPGNDNFNWTGRAVFCDTNQPRKRSRA